MKLNERGLLVVLSGPSGVGKGTVRKALFEMQNHNLVYSVSMTTRKPREGEVDGQDYYFVSKEEFIEGIKNDRFLEWAEFSGNLYGTNKDFVEKALKNNNVILEIDTQGAMQVKAKMPDAITIFIAPPSFEVLENRLRGRKTESEEAIQKRLNFVKIEMENSKNFDFVVINDNLETAIHDLERICEC